MPPKTVPRGKGKQVKVQKQLGKMKKAGKEARASYSKAKLATKNNPYRKAPSSAGSKAKTR